MSGRTINKDCWKQCFGFTNLLAEVPRAFDILGFGLASLFSGLLSANEEPRPRPVPLDPAPDDMILRAIKTKCMIKSTQIKELIEKKKKNNKSRIINLDKTKLIYRNNKQFKPETHT